MYALQKDCFNDFPISIGSPHIKSLFAVPSFDGWLVGCFGFNGPLRQYFSLYRAAPQREREQEEIG